MKIDAHQHFWRYSAQEYAWIDDSMAAIRRDFLPPDLRAVFSQTGIDGSVAVQARQTLAETEWLLELAARNPVIRGVVGWVPLVDAKVGGLLERFRTKEYFCGVRHVVQGEAEGFLDQPLFNRGIQEVTSAGLVYDVLIFARQLAEAIRFLDRHPKQRFVLDHIAKPVVTGAPDAAWRKHIGEFAKRENTFCKFSGVVTEVPGWTWTPELLRPYFEVVLEAFGPHRLMFGSDWPVCLVASDYGRWVNTVKSFAAALSQEEQSWLFGKTAITAYNLK
jgi:L-fuconolactonase